jgi:hypothetical protein
MSGGRTRSRCHAHVVFGHGRGKLAAGGQPQQVLLHRARIVRLDQRNARQALARRRRQQRRQLRAAGLLGGLTLRRGVVAAAAATAAALTAAATATARRCGAEAGGA